MSTGKSKLRRRRSAYAELDALVREELDALVPRREAPPREPRARTNVVDFERNESTATHALEASPSESRLTPGKDLETLFDPPDRELIASIAAQLQGRPNAEWMLEAVRELLEASPGAGAEEQDEIAGSPDEPALPAAPPKEVEPPHAEGPG